MDNKFEDLKLRTAFACMCCDGDIAPEEVALIRVIAHSLALFANGGIDERLHELLAEINEKGTLFLKEFLKDIASESLTADEELALLSIAVKTIQADNRIEYSEIKFFKALRANMKVVDDETILSHVEGIEDYYLSQDIRVEQWQLFENYLESVNLQPFPKGTFETIAAR